MFVEITRLLIVLAATAAGFQLAQVGNDTGTRAVVGAVLGALIGYVVGGAVGRLLRRAMGQVEAEAERASAPKLLAAGLGGALGGGLAAVIGLPLAFVVPRPWGWPLLALLVWLAVYEGATIAAKRTDDLLALAGLSNRPLVGSARYVSADGEGDAVLVDTSAIIDGRLLTLADTGFLRGSLLVPRFVLDELQGIADAADPDRRRRGRRGLEVLGAIRDGKRVDVRVVTDEVPEFAAVDAKLVALAKRLGAPLLTTDANLQHVAELQGVVCLNVHRLSDGLKPAHAAGEVLRIPISREGKEPGQGVGFLDDGTMVVVGEAATLVGQHVEVRITSNVQTSVGRMLFASVADAG